jgi:hypothetical protein
VDTVLVVARTPTLPTQRAQRGQHPSARRYQFVLEPAFAAAILGDQWPGPPEEQLAALQAMDLWHYNLIDADRGGHHEFTGIRDHRILVGAVAQPQDASEQLRLRRTSYVPLVDLDPRPPYPHRPLPPEVEPGVCAALWQALRTWVANNQQLTGRRRRTPPTTMPDDLGNALYDCVRTISGRGSELCGYVALPPLRWLQPNAPSASSHTGQGNC